ncbi:MAG: hypothetical protein DMG13_33305 [Acidobacteria bacterium]|nr:MAG: hypothetical protein DMG13_33305 [Acidobacteriota bacterium]
MKRLCLPVAIILFAVTVRAQTTKVTGTAADPSGALIVGADITLMGPGGGAILTTKTGPDGGFTIEVPPGSYGLEVSADGFEKVQRQIEAGPDSRPVTVTLPVAKMTQEVEVQDNPNPISLDPDNNQTALVLKEDDIQSLPDDEDELTAYLTELAGPRAAAAGGVQFIVDGFLGGRIPPKDQIREIRINTNPFTTEYSRAGFGRIEIITRPGTGKIRGNFNFNFRNDALNARNAFAAVKLPYSRQNYQGSVSGPFIHDKLTLTLFAQRNDALNTDTIRAITTDGELNSSIVKPNLRENFNSRGQYAISPNNTLHFNLESAANTRSNQGVGGFGLPERASNSKSNQFGLQLRDTAVLSTRFVHETRLEITRNHSTANALTQSVAINVLDAFQAGGSQNMSDETDRSFLFGDTLIFNSKGFTLKAGTQADYFRNRVYSANNFSGTFVFSSLDGYRDGKPTTFTMNRGNRLVYVSQLELGAFVQTDIKLSNRLLISPGLRYQIQTNLSDHNNFDPRVAVSFSLNKSAILRAGVGTFHQTFSTNLFQQLQLLDGTRQVQIVIRNPSFPDPFAGGIGQTIPSSLRVRSDNLVAPYTSNVSVSLEKSLKSGAVISIAYDFIRGNHVYRSRNINAPLPGNVVRPDPAQGNILQLESSGLSSFNGLTFGFRRRIGPVMNLFTNYTFSSSYNDTDGAFGLPANNYDLRSEWARSPDNQRHHFQAGINGRLPLGISVNAFMRLNSGRPYNITTGLDDNGDTVTNDRPPGLSRNAGQGPGLFDTSLNFSKTMSLVKGEKSSGEAAPGGGPRNGGELGGRGGGGGRGAGRFGGFGGRGGRGANGSPGRTATFFVNVQNLFNHTNRGNFSGVMTSPFFGKANSAQNPRQVELGIRFNF